MHKKMTIENLTRRSLLMLLVMASMISLLIPQASAASVPSVSSSVYISCYTLNSSGRVYAYTDSTLQTKTGGWIDCATDECRVIAVTSGAVQISYPVTGSGRRIAWFPRSAFTAFDLTGSGFTAVTASAKVTTYTRASGGTAYGYIAKGDRVVILGASGSRTQLLYPVGSHYKMAWADTSQVSKYLGGGSGAVTFSGTYTLYTALGNNLVLDVCGNSCDNGANIQIYSANSTSAQSFQIIPVSGEWCKIVHTHSGKAVDVSGGSAASQTNCQLWEDNGSDAQRWRFIPCGGGYLIQSKLGCYLDVAGGNAVSGNNVWLYTGNQSQAQIWGLSKTSAGSSAAQQVTAKLNQMMDGSYAGGDYKTGTTYRGPYYTEQCKGFAKSVFEKLFGYNIGSTAKKPNNYKLNIDTAKTRQVGTLTDLSTRSDSALKNLLTQARPGDFLQVRRSHGGSHSMIVLSTSSTDITVYECNVDGANGIRTATYTWASFRSVNAAVGLYTARDYSLHS